MEKDKVKCKECGWKGKKGAMLQAPNPFDLEDSVIGCPECLYVDTLEMVCDAPNCWSHASAGTPTESGYRWTCHKHKPIVI